MSTLKVTHLQNENGTGPAMSLAVGGGVTFAGITTFHGNVELGSNSLEGNLQVGTGATISGSTNTITALTNGSERLRINSSGQIGIGTDNPSTGLHLLGADSYFTMQSSSASGNAGILFKDSSGTQNSVIFYDFDDDYLKFSTTDDTEALRINSSGTVEIRTGSLRLGNTSGTDSIIHTDNAAGIIYRADENGHRFQTWSGSWQDRLTIDDNGRLILPTGSPGIQFGSPDSNGDITSQTLDDYEEGTWTPQARDNFSSGNQGSFDLSVGYYTKIGNQVTVWGRFSNVDTSGMNGSFDFCVAGLPFSASSNLTFATGTIHTNFFTFSGQINPRIEGARSSFRIQECASGSNNDFVTVSQVSSGTADAFFVLTYFV